jgi:hypothetical protein
MEKNLRKTILSLCLILLTLLLFPTIGFAAQNTLTEQTYPGLYLISGENIEIENININLYVEETTTDVEATYKILNTGETSTSFSAAIPESDLSEYADLTYYISPYWYDTSTMDNSTVNDAVENMEVESGNQWIVPSFNVPIEAGEEKEVTISYTINNLFLDEGKVTFEINTEHIQSWTLEGVPLEVEVQFALTNSKPYDFSNEYSELPTDTDTLQSNIWTYDSYEQGDTIWFNHYQVDNYIINQLATQNNPVLNNMLSAYDQYDNDSVIEYGKQYIENYPASSQQTNVYLLIADAYYNNKDYENAVIIYNVIDGTYDEYEGLEERVIAKVNYYKIPALISLGEYEEAYDLIIEMQAEEICNAYTSFLEDSYNDIPSEEIEAILESREEETGIIKFVFDFLEGKYLGYTISVIIAIIIVAVIYLVYKRKKKNRNKLKF